MSERIAALRTELAEAREHLDSVLDQVGDRWDTQVYAEGEEWTVQKLAVHLMISSRGHFDMATFTAQGKNLIPEDYSTERFNRGSVRRQADMTLDAIREELNAAYARLIDWLDNLDDDSVLDKEGRYATLEMLTVEEILRRGGGHERGHADDMARVLGIS